jgi:NhaA family Na+:H+ antiporter
MTRPSVSPSSALLVGATALALVWANSPWQSGYHDLWHTGAGALDLRAWVNEALMAVFFLVIALEVRGEIRHGELRDRRHAALPVAAAIGGMVVPAAIYLAVNAGSEHADGWGVPMATDIAFAVGVLALVAPRIPASLRVFLLTLAVVDDIGAIIVIAAMYSSDVHAGWIAAAVVTFAVLLVARRHLPIAAVAGILLWVALHEAGVHATLAGVAVGLVATVPARVEKQLQTWVGLAIIPLFALANAGVTFTSSGARDALASGVTWGIVLGLVVGKPAGIVGGAWLSQRTRFAAFSTDMRWRQLTGVAALGGIGFTVSIFITGLAFDEGAIVDEAKIGVFAATVLATILSALLLREVSDGRDETASART